ncbi:hypothetical protein BJY04DRAFT_10855 [Aspergillus karnatakaensis]|uniref:uncharacterized protein n=1 Tax=Aspergillus karnatakaensis TaxID=1810916 RepID=UPI003CCD9F2A
MARLCIPGIRSKKDPQPNTARFKSRPAFRSFPNRVTYRATGSFDRSFLPSPPSRRDSVRSFDESRLGSRLPIRSPTPTPRPSLSATSPRLEERRAARQARSRPWAQPRSPSTSSSNLSSANLRTSKTTTHAPLKKSTAFSRPVQAKPATSVKGGRKDKPTKRVRFGETTVVSVTRWIVRSDDVYPAPPMAMGHLQGWIVRSLSKPDEDGEVEKYTTFWGSDSYVMLTSNHRLEPCDREGCAWNSLARIQAMRPMWSPEMIFSAWHKKREMTRKRGGFAL